MNRHPHHPYLIENPLLRERDNGRRAQVLKLFPDVAVEGQVAPMSLCNYVERIPERFFSATARSEFSEWMSVGDRKSTFILELGGNHDVINSALRALGDVNSLDWHDLNEVGDGGVEIRHEHQTIARLELTIQSQ